MTAETVTEESTNDPILRASDPLGAARQYIAEAAFSAGAEHRVGLELEFQLVDLAEPARRPSWTEIQALVAALAPMPSHSSVSLEPGGQIELSTPPQPDVSTAISALRADRETLRRSLLAGGFGAAPLGADPARPVRRTNPHQRYAAMEQHFQARDCAEPGRAMMSSTAALQINLDAGPASGWSARMGLVQSLVPVLVAASASSPYLGGSTSGWHSMRQQTWHGIDHGRSDPIPSGEPSQAWARYALAAPVMLVRHGERLEPVTRRLSLADWLAHPDRLGRRAGRADLDYHLTTLFPPVRPRGYVEIRCIDALPDRWWPALAALTVTLVDDPVCADRALDLCLPVAHAWETAARSGLVDAGVRAAVTGCVELAASRCAPDLRGEIESFAELVAAGRTPSGELRARVEAHGPLRVLEEEAHA